MERTPFGLKIELEPEREFQGWFITHNLQLIARADDDLKMIAEDQFPDSFWSLEARYSGFMAAVASMLGRIFYIFFYILFSVISCWFWNEHSNNR